MRVPSGSSDRYLFFVAVDATDLKTRETGLSSFTVYRSRNGGAPGAFTTPTINETDTTNMPGVYELLIDEDTTIDADHDEEEMVVHITHAGMAPVTRTFELFRPKITEGQTVTAANGAVDADVERWQGTVVATPGTAGVPAVDAVRISNDDVAADRLETMLDGTGGNKLSLSQLNIVATGNDSAIVATGAGTGDGITATGGPTNGEGAKFTGAGNGNGLQASGAGTGAGIAAIGGSTDGTGFAAAGVGNGIGFYAAGDGSGAGFFADSLVSGHGFRARGAGAGHGIVADGGVSGVDVRLENAAVSLATRLSDIETDTQDIQSRIPAVLVSGRIDASVGAMAANVLTDTAINDGAITAAKIANAAIDAATFATGAIDANALAADAVAEIADGVWDEDATGHQTQGTFGQAVGDPVAAAPTIYEMVTDTFGLVGDVSNRLPLALVGGRIDANVGAISADAAAADALETMLDGSGGNKLSLSQLNIVAAGNDSAIVATGAGTGHGLVATGGLTNGIGIYGLGSGTGPGVRAESPDDAPGLHCLAGNAGGRPGAKFEGTNAGPGAEYVGAGGEPGISAQGGATAGAGIKSTGGTDGHGFHSVGVGDGDGIRGIGGVSDSAGMYLQGGSYGARVQGATTGMEVVGTAGEGARFTGAGAAGLLAQGEPGARFLGSALNNNGFEAVGVGTGHGLVADGGASGVDVRLENAAASLVALIAALQADTDDIQTRLPAALVSGRIDASVGAMANDSLTAAALATSAVDEIAAAIATEISDALTVDTQTLPGQTAPPSAPTIAQILTWLYKFMRNKKTATSSQVSLYDDAGTVVDAKIPVSEVADTLTKGKVVSGP